MEQNFDSNEHVVNQAAEQTTEHENVQQTVRIKPNNNMLMANQQLLNLSFSQNHAD